MNDGEHAQGCVFILYSADNILNDQRFVIGERALDEIADLKICSPKNDIYSRFGYSIATSSNDDGNYEIYIGAPSYGTYNLTYQGIVYYYESYINEEKGITFRVKRLFIKRYWYKIPAV